MLYHPSQSSECAFRRRSRYHSSKNFRQLQEGVLFLLALAAPESDQHDDHEDEAAELPEVDIVFHGSRPLLRDGEGEERVQGEKRVIAPGWLRTF